MAGDVIASFALIARAYGRSAAPTAAGGPPTGRPTGTRPRVPAVGSMSLRRLHMSETIPMSAADLVVHGTFDLRYACSARRAAGVAAGAARGSDRSKASARATRRIDPRGSSPRQRTTERARQSH